MSEVVSVPPEQVKNLLVKGAVALDIRGKKEHDADQWWAPCTSAEEN
jgi:hypothetical protein